MKKLMLALAVTAACGAPAIAQETEAPGTETMTIGNFDSPGDTEKKEGAGSAWERAPFNWYYKYSGCQMIYSAGLLEQLAADDGAITEVVFKYGDDGSTVWLQSDITIIIEETQLDEFERKPDTNIFYWATYDPSAPTASIAYDVELYYYEDEELHFVLDRPLQYTGGNLLITAWSEVTNDVEAQNTFNYVIPTGKYTTMSYGSDRNSFAHVYDTGEMEPYQGPNKYVPVLKLVYTKGAGIGTVAGEIDEAAATLYNLQGQEVSGTPAPGLYIRRQGTTATKVLVK